MDEVVKELSELIRSEHRQRMMNVRATLWVWVLHVEGISDPPTMLSSVDNALWYIHNKDKVSLL